MSRKPLTLTQRRPFSGTSGFAAKILLSAVSAVGIALILLDLPAAQILPGFAFALVAAGTVGFLLQHSVRGHHRGLRKGEDGLAASALLPASDAAAVIEGLAVPLLRFSAEGQMVQANAAARHLLDITGDELPEPTQVFMDLGRPVRDWIRDVAQGLLPGGSEVVGLRGAEADRFLQVTLRPDGQGGVLALAQDATTLKRLEVQFAQGQKMQAIGQLTGGIAHDFNNLLTAISGHCDLLLLRHRADSPDHADLTQIRQNANRAAALVGQLLAFSRKQTLKPERIDLHDALADMAHLLNRLLGERVTLDVIHAREPLAIRVDPRQLEQVIMNLAVNARDAMPEGGVVQIRSRSVLLDQEVHRDGAVVPRGHHAVITVSDSGCGIPADRLGKIFDPFFTTKRPGEGTGLGLATVYGIVKQSGGFVFVESEPDVGSDFEIWFPLCREQAAAPVLPPRVKRRVRRTDAVILLVEDETPVRAFAARALRLSGLSVIEADSAEEALRLLDDPRLQVDVFVTDVVMPGLDGPEWVIRALHARPETRTVFMSGYAEEALSDLQARVPNSVFLPKPFSLASLTETVQAQLAA